jgi:hypothetical protein
MLLALPTRPVSARPARRWKTGRLRAAERAPTPTLSVIFRATPVITRQAHRAWRAMSPRVVQGTSAPPAGRAQTRSARSARACRATQSGRLLVLRLLLQVDVNGSARY